MNSNIRHQQNEDAEENLAWEEIRTEHIVQDEWIDFRRSAYRFPDGSVFEPYYSYSRRDYVVIVASDEDGNYLCVRQFRQGIREVTTEFPAGGIERADGREYRQAESGKTSSDMQRYSLAEDEKTSADKQECCTTESGTSSADGQANAEDALDAARRELLEETGYVSDDWQYLLTVPSNATIADNYAHIFSATGCRKAREQSLDETEFLNVRKYSAAEIEEMIAGGGFQQAVHIMAWLLAQRKTWAAENTR